VRVSPWWASLTLIWVCVQGAFGALTVTMKLFPAIVTLHLLGGMGLLALLAALAERYRESAGLGAGARSGQSLGWRDNHAAPWAVGAVFALLWVQLALGGWVSTNYAVLVCGEFPQCQGQWWPPMDWRQAFELWRELGATQAGGSISFQALTAIHMAHRAFAGVVFAAVIALALYLRQSPAQRTRANWLLALCGWQLATGLANVVLGWPLLAAVAHTGGAAGLVVVLTGALMASLQRGADLGTSRFNVSRFRGARA
jgi:cytochrome c oxidase assembly protein subunit 15